MDPMTTSALISAGGSLLGGFFGGKKSQSTVDTTPAIYKSKEGQELLKQLTGGYGQLLQGSLDAYQIPFTPAPTGRVMADTGYGGLFNNPEMMQIQTNSDRDYISKLMNPQPETQAASPVTPQASAFSPQDEVFIKQIESGQLPYKQYAMQYQDALKRRQEAGKVPLPMGGYQGGV